MINLSVKGLKLQLVQICRKGEKECKDKYGNGFYAVVV